MPKQFLPLVGEKSTYQQALMRVSGDALWRCACLKRATP